MRGISENELFILDHIIRWGSDGYPIRKIGRRFIWAYQRSPGEGVESATAFKTKREAIASFEAYMEILLDAKAGRI